MNKMIINPDKITAAITLHWKLRAADYKSEHCRNDVADSKLFSMIISDSPPLLSW